MGQRVGEASLVDEVTREHLVAEAASWGLRSKTAADIVDDMLRRITNADIDESWLAELVSSNLERIG